MNTRRFWIPFAIFALVVSCASTPKAQEPHWVVDAEHDRLLGHEAKNDLPLRATCAPDTANKAKCIALTTESYFKMVKELQELRQGLKDCQKGARPAL